MNRLRSNPWAVLVVLCLGFFMILLDTTIVNIAIPSIIDNINASLDQVLWVINGYILVYAVLLITAGRLGDLYGQRNLFAGGMALFVIASAFCGLAQNPDQLIAGRIVQGIGGALLTPQTLSMLTTIFPPDRRGAAFGIWGAIAGIAAVTGPVLGGLIINAWSWRAIFYVNLPIGIVALAATFLIVPDLRPGRRHRLDMLGVILASAGLFAIVFGLIEGERYNWGSFWGWLTIPEVIAVGVLFLVGFAVWERYQAEPLVPLSLFSDRNYSIMNGMTVLVAFGMLGLFFPITIFLQSVRGMSPLEAGLTMSPMALIALFVAPLSGRLADKIGGKYILMVGLLLFGVGMGAVAWLAEPDATWSTLLVPFIIAGFGQGCVMAPSQTIAMRHISPQMAGAASGVINATRQLGALLGSAIVGAILQNQLSIALHDQAVGYAAQLPIQYQQRFVDAIATAAKGGINVGRSGSGGIQLPFDLPPQLAGQLQQLFHDVFAYGFAAAIRPTLIAPVVALLIGAVLCLAIEGKEKAMERAEASQHRANEHSSLSDQKPRQRANTLGATEVKGK